MSSYQGFFSGHHADLQICPRKQLRFRLFEGYAYGFSSRHEVQGMCENAIMLLEPRIWGNIGIIWGLCWDNGKENGNYYIMIGDILGCIERLQMHCTKALVCKLTSLFASCFKHALIRHPPAGSRHPSRQQPILPK